MEELIKNTPNDYDLGEKIHKMYLNGKIKDNNILTIIKNNTNYMTLGELIRKLF